MQTFNGKELMESFVGLSDSLRSLEALACAPEFEAKLRNDIDLDWAFTLLVEAGITPDGYRAIYELRHGHRR